MTGSMRRRGFTLLETVFAVAVFAIAIGFLSATFYQILMAQDRVRYRESNEINHRLLREAVLGANSLEAVEEGSEVELPGGGRVTWRGRVEPGEVTNTVILQVELISGEEYLGNSRDTLVLRLYRPEWIDAMDREAIFFRREEVLRRDRPSQFDTLTGTNPQ